MNDRHRREAEQDPAYRPSDETSLYPELRPIERELTNELDRGRLNLN
jgi:hypothetical protein